MGFFDKFKQKEKNSYPKYLPQGNYQSPKWTTQRDEQYLTEAFNKIVWIYTCATLISSNSSKVNWELWRKGKGEKTKDRQIYEHPLLVLSNDRINPHFSSKDFFELWALGLALQGKFYAKLNSANYPTRIYPLYGHKTKPIPDSTNFISGFEYEVRGEPEFIKDDLMLWSKFNDPSDYYEGLSPIRACARTVDTENEAVNWNKSQLQNQAVPVGAIQVENPSPDLVTKLRTEWKKRYAGSRNVREPLILNSEKASFVPFGFNTVDMDFINQRLNNRIEICSVFKVPPQVAGDTQSQTFANYEQAMKSFWEQCIIPEYLDRMKDDLNLYLASRYADNLEFRYNLDDIGVLHEGNDAKMKRATEGYTKGVLTRNEARFLVDHDEVENGDEFISKVTEEEEKKLKDDESKKKQYFKKAINMSDADKESYWRDTEKKREEYIKAVIKLFGDNFTKEKNGVTRAISEGKSWEKVIDNLSTDKQKILIALYRKTIRDFGEQTYNKIARTRKADTEFIVDDLINEYILTQTGTQIKEINSTTVDQVQQRIKLGQQDGLDINSIAKMVDDLYLEQIIPNRSTVIARTETISSSNYGSLAGAKQIEEDFDVEVKKMWLPTYDARVRDTHLAMKDHKAIPLNEKFKVGQSKLEYPADFSGGVKEAVNCRCTLIYTDDE